MRRLAPLVIAAAAALASLAAPSAAFGTPFLFGGHHDAALVSADVADSQAGRGTPSPVVSPTKSPGGAIATPSPVVETPRPTPSPTKVCAMSARG